MALQTRKMTKWSSQVANRFVVQLLLGGQGCHGTEAEEVDIEGGVQQSRLAAAIQSRVAGGERGRQALDILVKGRTTVERDEPVRTTA
jgi:hypothetical protein